MIRVLIVDDSPAARRLFRQILSAESAIEVAGEAADPFEAQDFIVAHEPDVVLLDLEMPRMDGLTFLRRLMRHHPMPVVIVSSLSVKGSEVAFVAMRAGAVEVISKPSPAYSVEAMAADLVAAVRGAAGARGHPRTQGGEPAAPVREKARSWDGRRIVAVGASTGGTVAIEQILRALPGRFAPVVVTQHMPSTFTEAFAQRLSRVTALDVREARDGDLLEPGRVLVAPGGKHLLLQASGERYLACVKEGPQVNGHRPSVDVLFKTVARVAGPHAVGVILTGMGRDGAKGLVEMHAAGARTIAQDEASCVVFGMPAAAIELGAVDEVVPLREIPTRIVAALGAGAGGSRHA